MNLEGLLWIRGEDRSVHSSVDVTTMGASGTLIENALERILQLVCQVVVYASSPTREFSNRSTGSCFLAKNISVAEPNSHVASPIGSLLTSFAPQKCDDDLRMSGRAIASAYENDIESWNDCATMMRWICRISLALGEYSVSTLSANCCLLG